MFIILKQRPAVIIVVHRKVVQYWNQHGYWMTQARYKQDNRKKQSSKYQHNVMLNVLTHTLTTMGNVIYQWTHMYMPYKRKWISELQSKERLYISVNDHRNESLWKDNIKESITGHICHTFLTEFVFNCDKWKKNKHLFVLYKWFWK